MRPFTTAGYGSPSSVSHGAAFCTISRGDRSYRILAFLLIAPDSSRFLSWNFDAYSSLRKNESMRTPPCPS